MHDRAAVGWAIHQRDVLLDAIEGFHLEAPPVGPHRRADIFLRQPVGQLVGLHRVVERSDLEAEFFGQIEHGRHFIGTVAMDVHTDIAINGPGQGV